MANPVLELADVAYDSDVHPVQTADSIRDIVQNCARNDSEHRQLTVLEPSDGFTTVSRRRPTVAVTSYVLTQSRPSCFAILEEEDEETCGELTKEMHEMPPTSRSSGLSRASTPVDDVQVDTNKCGSDCSGARELIVDDEGSAMILNGRNDSRNVTQTAEPRVKYALPISMPGVPTLAGGRDLTGTSVGHGTVQAGSDALCETTESPTSHCETQSFRLGSDRVLCTEMTEAMAVQELIPDRTSATGSSITHGVTPDRH